MANTTLTQTGAQVQADLNKVEGLANIKTIGSGLSLSSAGNLSANGGGAQLFLHTIHISEDSPSNASVHLYLVMTKSTPYLSFADYNADANSVRIVSGSLNGVTYDNKDFGGICSTMSYFESNIDDYYIDVSGMMMFNNNPVTFIYEKFANSQDIVFTDSVTSI